MLPFVGSLKVHIDVKFRLLPIIELLALNPAPKYPAKVVSFHMETSRFRSVGILKSSAGP
jgi:hypothetical protein